MSQYATSLRVQLRMNWNEKSEHDRLTVHLLNKILVGDSEMQQERVGVASLSGTVTSEKAEGMMNSGIYRYLMHCTFDPRLGKLTVLVQKR